MVNINSGSRSFNGKVAEEGTGGGGLRASFLSRNASVTRCEVLAESYRWCHTLSH